MTGRPRFFPTAGHAALVLLVSLAGVLPAQSTGEAHESDISALAFRSDGRLLISGDARGIVKSWEPADGKYLQSYPLFQEKVISLQFADPNRLVAAGDPGLNGADLMVWDTASGNTTRASGLHFPKCLAVSPDGKTAAYCDGGQVHYLDAQTMAPLQAITEIISLLPRDARPDLRALAFSPDSRWLALVDRNSTAIYLADTSVPEFNRKVVFSLAGHRAPVQAIAFSGDGKFLASAGDDNRIILWSVQATGPWQPVTEFGTTAPIRSLAFDPRSRRLAAGAADGSILLFDMQSAKAAAALPSSGKGVLTLAFSPSGDRLAAGYEEGALGIWGISDLKLLFDLGHKLVVSESEPVLQFSAGHAQTIQFIDFPPGDAWFVSASDNGVIKFWDAHTRRQLATLPGSWELIHGMHVNPATQQLEVLTFENLRQWDIPKWRASGEPRQIVDSSVEAAVFSRDGRVMITGSPKGIEIRPQASQSTAERIAGVAGKLTALAASEDFSRIASLDDAGRRLAVFNVASRQPVRVWEKLPAEATAAALSPDGKLVCAAMSTQPTRQLWIWEIADTVAEPRKFDLEFNRATAAAFTPDGKEVLIGYLDGSLQFVKSGNGSRNWLSDPGPANQSVRFSPAGRWMLVASTPSTSNTTDLMLFDLGSGVLAGHWQGAYLAYGFSGESLFTVTNSGSGQLLYQFPQSGALRTVDYHNLNAIFAYTDNQGRYAAILCADRTIHIFNVANGEQLWEAKLDRYFPNAGVEYAAVRSFSPDGRVIAIANSDAGGNDEHVALIESDSGKPVREFHESGCHFSGFAESDAVVALECRPPNSFAVQRLYDIATGRAVHDLPAAAVFSRDGKRLAVFGSTISDGNAKGYILEAGTWNTVHTLLGHSGNVKSFTFSPDGRFLVSCGDDRTLRIWNVEDGTLVSLMQVQPEARDWAIVSPAGFFDGTPPAWRNLSWRFSNALSDVAPVESFLLEFFQPGLLAAVMDPKGGAGLPAHAALKTLDRRLPRVTVTGTPTAGGNEGALEVRIAVPAKASVSGVRLFRNGLMVKRWNQSFDQPEVLLRVSVPLVSGENRFTAYAFNQDNVKSEDDGTVINGPQRARVKGTLHLLTIGVNEYSSPAFRLYFAVKDAEDFASEVALQQEAVGDYTVRQWPLRDAQATGGAIRETLRQVVAAAKPEDAVVIFFAGHGKSLGDRFYIFPHDLGYSGEVADFSGDSLTRVGISDVELEDILAPLDATHVALILDACNSGKALDAEEKRRGPINSPGLGQLAYEKGMYILAASQSFEYAHEHQELQHGDLTYALIEQGLRKGQADRAPKDGIISLVEWMEYAVDAVPQLQVPQSKERGVSLVAPGPVPVAQTPRLYYRRDAESTNLVIGKTPL